MSRHISSSAERPQSKHLAVVGFFFLKKKKLTGLHSNAGEAASACSRDTRVCDM